MSQRPPIQHPKKANKVYTYYSCRRYQIGMIIAVLSAFAELFLLLFR